MFAPNIEYLGLAQDTWLPRYRQPDLPGVDTDEQEMTPSYYFSYWRRIAFWS
jgi:hypothetical protein